MPRRKARTSISIPQSLLSELDRRAGEDGRTRSDLVCEAVVRYFASEQDRLLAEGYREMAAETKPAGEETEGMPGGAATLW